MLYASVKGPELSARVNSFTSRFIVLWYMTKSKLREDCINIILGQCQQEEHIWRGEFSIVTVNHDMANYHQ